MNSTLCCAVLAPTSNVLSPMRIRVPTGTISGELSDGDSPATTPEACTDSENDSSFETDDEGATSSSRNRKKARLDRISWPRCTATKSRSKEKQQRHQTRLPTPQPRRKVRFTLHTDHQHAPAAAAAGRASASAKERRSRSLIQDIALVDVGMMHPAARAAQLVQRQWRRRGGGQSSSSDNRTARSSSSADSALSACNNRMDSAATPFKRTSTNASVPVRRTPHPSIATPASPHKRKVSSSSSQSRLCSRRRADGDGDGGGRGDPLVSCRRPTRPSRGTAAVETGQAKAAALEAKGASSTSRTLPCAPATSARAAKSPLPSAAIPMDLLCNEEVDMDAAMKPSGEVRTPICRFRLPCWPEGVEGYQEAGGWRRLGGSYTRDNFPRGRRGI